LRRALVPHRSGTMGFRRVPGFNFQQTLSRELRAMGFRKLSARPRHHAQDEKAVAAFKKTSPPSETWFFT